MKKVVFSVLFFWFSADIAWALTVAQINTAVRQNVRDTDTNTSNQAYSDAVLLVFENEAQKEINNITSCMEATTSYTLTAGVTYYNLPDNYLAAKLVTFTDANGSTKELTEISEKRIYQTSPDFELSSIGEPSQYFTSVPQTGTTMQVSYVPIPSAASTGTVTVQYLFQPTDLTSTSDVPFDGFKYLLPYHYAIVCHVTARIKAIESKSDEALYYNQLFDRYMAIMRDKVGAAPNYLPAARGAAR